MSPAAFYRGLRAAFAGLLLPLGLAFAYLTDTNVHAPPNYYTFQPPSVGNSYTDPVFGTGIKRITDALHFVSADTGTNATYIVHEYSTMSPFNGDNSRVLLIVQSYFAIWDGSGNFVKNCPLEVNASSEPRWSRTDPQTFYYHSGNQLKSYNVATGAISLVHAFSEYGSISGRGESDISYDGDHFVFAGDNRYVFVYQISTNTKGPVFDTSVGGSWDSLYISPKNNVLISWLNSGTARYQGQELYDQNMNFLRQVGDAGGHKHMTLDTDGSEVLIWTSSADPHPICNNGIVKIRLADATQTCLVSLDWSLAVHISAPDNSGWAFVETYAPSDPNPTTTAWKTYTNEILQVKLDGTEVRRLLDHRSRPFNSYNYEPKVSVSRDGSRFVYSSNYGLQAILGYPAQYGDVYLVTVPGSSTTGGGGGGSTGGTVTRYEQNNAAVQYTGSWFTVNQSQFSGGSAVEAMDAGSQASFTFTGTAVSWIGYNDQWSGIANVYLDGVLKATVDTYSSPAQAQVVNFTATGLSFASHTLVIQVTGNHDASSGGSWVWVDAFDVTSGSTVSATSLSINAPAVTNPSNANVTVTVSSTAGAPTGNVSLSVDGGVATTQALSNGSTTFVLISPAVGSHTLSAAYAAQGNFAASSGTATLTVNPPGKRHK